jgi:hypothetical protein
MAMFTVVLGLLGSGFHPGAKKVLNKMDNRIHDLVLL